MPEERTVKKMFKKATEKKGPFKAEKEKV